MEKITYCTNSGEFEAEKLLPCPFCGGEPEFITIGNEATKNRKAQIECTKCHVRRTTGAIRNSLEWCGRKAIELWNARWQETSYENAALPLHDVNGSYCYEIDFGGNCKTKIETTKNEPKVLAAMNGWGDGISLNDIKITKL